MNIQKILIVLVTLVLVSCQSSVEFDKQSTESDNEISIIAFGDSGYHPDYLEKKYYEKPFTTREEFIADHRKNWLRKNKPIDEFTVPAMEFHAPSGSYIAKSSLYDVANAMISHCEQNDCDFSVMLGDNIYPDGATLGADGIDDATRFRDILSLPFAKLGAGDPDFKIYATLGNHDWITSRAGAMAQVEFLQQDKKFYMDGLFYSVLPPAANGAVEIFVVDTEILLASTRVKVARLNKDGTEQQHDDYKTPRASAVPQNDKEKNMVSWLEQGLKNSTAQWKIVMGHHPMWSAGGSKFEEGRAIRRLIRPLVCEHADMYLAGHEHTLEAYADNCSDIDGMKRNKELLHVVSGAAGKVRSVHSTFLAQQNITYPQRKTLFAIGMTAGFSQIKMKANTIEIVMFTVTEDGAINRVYQQLF